MLGTLAAGVALAAPTMGPHTWEDEVVYQIFPRSFSDSNGDGIGDLKGIEDRLPYVRWLGATAILINPVAKSRVYHNYFADDFFSIDPEFGTQAEFFGLVRKAHRLGLKVLLDMEPQYVTERHPWWSKPGYTWKEGSMWYGMRVPWYDGADVQVAAIDPANPQVLADMKRLFRFWAAPDGQPATGVDGFRIDHMMDDLDSKHVMTGMLGKFWRPILEDVRSVKPNTFFVGEQADWGFGRNLLADARADAVFDFPLQIALSSLDAAPIARAVEAACQAPAKWVTFIENHDTMRFASVVRSDSRKLRLGAVLNLACAGIPAIYYGQELGMKGVQGKWNTDGNDIPVRLAMRWSRRRDAKGTALWYRDSGPWWSDEFSTDDDGISVEEQAKVRGSLLSFYRRLISIRKRSPALRHGTQEVVPTPEEDGLVAFERQDGRDRIVVILNFSDSVESFAIDSPGRNLLTGRRVLQGAITLEPYGAVIVQVG